jgi:hypothetical protein
MLLKIIENFKVYSGDNNINYMSCDMLWKIGDYLNNLEINDAANETKNSLKQEDFSRLVKIIFEKLTFLCLDAHAEARHSAIHIFS